MTDMVTDLEGDELRVGSLFSGYGGLDMAVEDIFGGQTVWVSEIDKAACKVLEARFPDVPNLGDVTKIDWHEVPPIDILNGSSPCQDLSVAGPRDGMTEGTRSNLWVNMREAIAVLRPKIVCWENVRGALSAKAASFPREEVVESGTEDGTRDEAVCEVGRGSGSMVGDGNSPEKEKEVVLKALGRVLGDLASLGYDAGWTCLPASAVGAAHQRYRVFVLATDREGFQQ